MFSFTKQEKSVLIFFVVSIFCGSFFLLVEKKHPDIFEMVEHVTRKKVYINSATLKDWESLPGVGAHRAVQIIEERKRCGRFQSIEDVRYVKGIGPYVFNKIKPYLRED